MDRTRAAELLRVHRDELEALEAERNDIDLAIDAVKVLISVYGPLAGETADSPSPRARRTTQGPGLKRVLARLLDDRPLLTIDGAMEHLAQMPDYANGNMPSRNTVGSRLSDLAREGKARNKGFGVYERSATREPASLPLDRSGDDVE